MRLNDSLYVLLLLGFTCKKNLRLFVSVLRQIRSFHDESFQQNGKGKKEKSRISRPHKRPSCDYYIHNHSRPLLAPTWTAVQGILVVSSNLFPDYPYSDHTEWSTVTLYQSDGLD